MMSLHLHPGGKSWSEFRRNPKDETRSRNRERGLGWQPYEATGGIAALACPASAFQAAGAFLRNPLGTSFPIRSRISAVDLATPQPKSAASGLGSLGIAGAVSARVRSGPRSYSRLVADVNCDLGCTGAERG